MPNRRSQLAGIDQTTEAASYGISFDEMECSNLLMEFEK